MIVGPALQSLTFTAHEDVLRSMFVRLIASASDTRSSDQSHPAYVEIIKQLSPFDAELLKMLGDHDSPLISLANSKNDGYGFDLESHIIAITPPENLDYYAKSIENLHRLRVFNINYTVAYQNDIAYAKNIEIAMKKYPSLVGISDLSSVEEGKFVPVYRKGVLKITPFGRDFIKTCVN